MVAYSFQKRFVDPILFGDKRQTIRAIGKRRHARPGDEMQLYTGMRTRSCSLIGKAKCKSVAKIEIDFRRPCIDLAHESGTPSFLICRPSTLDAFARLDGFSDFNEFLEFWTFNYGPLARWSGVLIQWREFSP